MKKRRRQGVHRHQLHHRRHRDANAREANSADKERISRDAKNSHPFARKLETKPYSADICKARETSGEDDGFDAKLCYGAAFITTTPPSAA